ncbi:MAG: CYTH domain-containing protein [Pseudomonadota bacterium]|nr:CYTH domain-containing protein [Pseudomonadota bacterium]
MAVEIERKFLVDQNLLPDFGEGTLISQGYIETTTKNVVRARVKGDKGFLTLKGESHGATCAEFEYEIPKADALNIIATMCSGKTVEKTRYEYPLGKHVWEVDVFSGRNQGLIVAEIELASEDETFEKPEWIAEEVTGQAKYFNACLLNTPYLEW